MNKKWFLQSVVAIILLANLALSAACVPTQAEGVAEAAAFDYVASPAQQMLREQIERTQALRKVVVESALASNIVEEEMERSLARGSLVAEVPASNEPVPSVQELINDKIELALAGDPPGAHSTVQPALDAHIARALAFIEAAAEETSSNVAASAAQPALDAHIARALVFIEAGARAASDSSITGSPEQQMLREQIERVRALKELEG